MSGLDGLMATMREDPQKALLGAAAVAGVVGFAVFHKKSATAAAATTDPTTATTAAAGLTTPNTSATDIENQVQDMLNAFQQSVTAQLQEAQLGNGTKTTTTPVVHSPILPVYHFPGSAKPVATAPVPTAPKSPTLPRLRPVNPATIAASESYTVPPGGTLLSAAQHLYGADQAPQMVEALAAHNGITTSVRSGDTYATVHPGQKIVKA